MVKRKGVEGSNGIPALLQVGNDVIRRGQGPSTGVSEALQFYAVFADPVVELVSRHAEQAGGFGLDPAAVLQRLEDLATLIPIVSRSARF